MGNDEEICEHLSQGSVLVRRNGVVRVRKAPELTAEEHEAELASHLCSKYEALRIAGQRLQHRLLTKADVSKEPHWLYKDFNVLYRVAQTAAYAMEGWNDREKALAALKAQLERLAPAFTDTEEIRAAMRGE